MMTSQKCLFLAIVFMIMTTTTAVGLYAAPLRIIVVGDNAPYDQLLVDFIKSSTQAMIDVSCTSGTYQNLNDVKMAELKAADLIIFARSTNSKDYDDPFTDPGEPDFWNGVSTPLLILSPFFTRTRTHSADPRWHWIDSNSYLTTGTQFATLQVTSPEDPIFQGIDVSNGTVRIFSNENNSLRHVIHNMEGNHGKVLAIRPSDRTAPVIVRWTDTDQSFHPKTMKGPGGVRFLFGIFDDANQDPPGQTPQAFVDQIAQLTPEGKQLFKNILYDLLPALKP